MTPSAVSPGIDVQRGPTCDCQNGLGLGHGHNRFAGSTVCKTFGPASVRTISVIGTALCKRNSIVTLQGTSSGAKGMKR